MDKFFLLALGAGGFVLGASWLSEALPDAEAGATTSGIATVFCIPALLIALYAPLLRWLAVVAPVAVGYWLFLEGTAHFSLVWGCAAASAWMWLVTQIDAHNRDQARQRKD